MPAANSTETQQAIKSLADAVEQLRFILVGEGEPSPESRYLPRVAIIDAAVTTARASLSEAR